MRLFIAVILMLAAATAGRSAPLTRAKAYARAAALEALGRKLFFEPALSASGKMACATCHDPRHGFGRQTIDRFSSAGATCGNRDCAPCLR
jgi:cytochrome c peroxidase